jgi:hypothetical protein
VTFDLENLRARHPRMYPEHAASLALHAAVALQQQGHDPGVHLVVQIEDRPAQFGLDWSRRRNPGGDALLDRKHVKEFGAEAIALALVHEVRGLVALRKLPEGESADWLLRAPDGVRVALEVTGTAHGDAKRRMRVKLAQVAKYKGRVGARSACVVRFREPATWLKDVEASR